MPISFTLPDGEAPAPTGGTITNGDYTLNSVVFYGENAGQVAQEYLVLRNGSFDRNRTTITRNQANEARSVGTYTTMGTALVLEGTACLGGLQYIETVRYSTSGPSLEIFRGTGDQVFSVESYSR